MDTDYTDKSWLDLITPLLNSGKTHSIVQTRIYHRTLDIQQPGFSSISHVQALSAVMTVLFTLLPS